MSDFEKEYFAENYHGDYLSHNPQRKIKAYYQRILAIITHGTLLDVGCGTGVYLQHAKQYFQIAGTDISEYAINEAKKTLPEARLLAINFLAYPEEKHFDVITCFDVLEHIPQLDEAFQKLKRLLTPDGYLAITVPVYDTFVGKIVMALDRDPTHVHKRERDFWLDKLKEHGFEIVYHEGLFRKLFGKIYIFFFTRLLKRCSPAIFLIARLNKS